MQTSRGALAARVEGNTFDGWLILGGGRGSSDVLAIDPTDAAAGNDFGGPLPLVYGFESVDAALLSKDFLDLLAAAFGP